MSRKKKKELDKWGISKRPGNQDLFSLLKCIWIKLKSDLSSNEGDVKPWLEYNVGTWWWSHQTSLDIVLYKIMCYAYFLSKHICKSLGKRVESSWFISTSCCTVVLATPGSVMATANLFSRQPSYPGAEKTMPYCELTQDFQMWCNVGVPMAWTSQTHRKSQLACACQPESMRKTRVKPLLLTDGKDTFFPSSLLSVQNESWDWFHNNQTNHLFHTHLFLLHC